MLCVFLIDLFLLDFFFADSLYFFFQKSAYLAWGIGKQLESASMISFYLSCAFYFSGLILV